MGRFGHLGLLNGEWEVIGKVSDWSRSRWPMPPFLRWEEGWEVGIMCTYDQNTLETISEKISINKVNVGDYPVDRLMGYGAVEIRLTKLLAF